MEFQNNSHSKTIGYLLLVFGFTGSHRFFYGKPITGTIWFCTFGLLGIGWLMDFFLIPSMAEKADRNYAEGKINYNLTWILLTFFGIFGIHRFYLGKYFSGLIYLLTGGLFLLGIIYDFWTINEQIDKINSKQSRLYF
jgi:TM2 domain-containing membrane protein YozV